MLVRTEPARWGAALIVQWGARSLIDRQGDGATPDRAFLNNPDMAHLTVEHLNGARNLRNQLAKNLALRCRQRSGRRDLSSAVTVHSFPLERT